MQEKDGMNNKFFFLSLFSALLILISCGERYSKAIDIAYELSGTKPDSSIAILNSVNRSKLCKSEKARFALIYTIAQDKSGLDVDNDSLLRIAYTYFNSRYDDSLYAKSMYYMGKYYLLNDSSELATDCLQKSAEAAEKHGDKYIQSLALEKLSKVISNSNPQKAVALAMKVEKLYTSIPNLSHANVIYSKLNVSEALLFNDSIQQAERKCNEALAIALASRDSSIISDTFQDISSILSEKGDFKKALWYSKRSFELSKSHDTSKLLNLAWAYLDADSLKECDRLLGIIRTSKPSSLYTAYYIRHIAAIKRHAYDKAIIYADSSYHYIEKMYSEELGAKEKYYNSLVRSQYDKGVSEGKSTLFIWIIILVALSSILAIAFILYSYRQYKLKAKYRIQSELREREAERKIHDEEMKHKEIQFSTMRGYILKKVSMAQKIEEIKGNKEHNVLFTPEDWEEIQLFVNSVEDGFATRIKKHFHSLTDEDVKFLMLIRLRMPAKAMGMIYNISEKSIRQKLFVYKSKVGLDRGKNMSLRSFIETF